MTQDDPLGPMLTSAPPVLSMQDALALLQTHYGLSGDALALTSERDLNFRISTGAGRFVLKIANDSEPPAVTRFQNAALLHIAARDPALPVPRVVPTRAGTTDVVLPSGSLMRLLTYVEGVPMYRAAPSQALRRSMGAMAARLTRALEGFAHPAADHVLQWDLKQAAALRPLLPAIADDALRGLCSDWLDRFTREIKPALAFVPWQVVHADLNPHNVLVDPEDATRVSGVLDFGDMVHTPRLCDLAVAASYQIDVANPLDSLADVVAAWHRELPLQPAEQALIFDLTAIRMVTTLAITSFRAARYPENATYILRNFETARAGLLGFASLPRDAALARMRME